MNTIIQKLSQIEEKSTTIISSAAARKKTLAEEYEARGKQFDQALDQKTERKLNTLREAMEADVDARLKKQEADAKESVRRLERHYEVHHKQYVDRLFREMTEV